MVEEETIRALVDWDVVVVCGYEGGTPMAEDRIGRLTGVEAVVDKDMTAARLALALRADRLRVPPTASPAMAMRVQSSAADRVRRVTGSVTMK